MPDTEQTTNADAGQVDVPVGPLVERLRAAAHAMDVNMDAMLMDEAADALESHQRMFYAAVSALAEVDRLLGVEGHSCNDPQQTVSALKDVLANKLPNASLSGGRRPSARTARLGLVDGGASDGEAEH